MFAPLGEPGFQSSGALTALLAALFWGGGDFAGGMGVRAGGSTPRGALRFIVAAHSLSLLALFVSLLCLPAPIWHRGPVLWAMLAGVIAGLSLISFYLALSRGAMGGAAAISGLLAAAIPAGLSALVEGRPGVVRLAGFGVAALAIWFIAAPPRGEAASNGTSALALAGGMGFGLYFTALKWANPLGPVASLLLARVGGLLICLVCLGFLGIRAPLKAGTVQQGWLPRAGWLWAVAVAALDTAGNLLYIAATRAGRLDVAAVLASLYPASTILLAAAVLRERPRRLQLAGMGLAVVAVVLIVR